MALTKGSLETSAFQIFPGGNSTFINSFDETKFSCFTLPLTQHHNFLRNNKFVCIGSFTADREIQRKCREKKNKKHKKKTGKISPLKAVQRHNRLFNLENMYFVQVSRHLLALGCFTTNVKKMST